MILYSPYSGQRVRQVVADAAGVIAVVVTVLVTSAVVTGIRALAELGRQLEEAGGSITEGLTSAGDRLAGIPLIGDAIAAPFTNAAGAGDSVSDTGTAIIDIVETTATIAGWIVALALLSIIALVWVVPRARFVVRRRRAERMLTAGMGADTFALRAIATARLSALGRVHPDPGAAVRAGDTAAIRGLAELQLRRLGVAPDLLP